MVKQVNTPSDYRLLTQGKRNYSRFAMQTLKNFSVTKLLETKLVTKNFKAGLEFSDMYVSKITHNKLARMLTSVFLKEVSCVNFTNTPEGRPYIATDLRNTWIKLIVTRDPAILRYLRFLNAELIKVKAPYTFNYANDTHEHCMLVYLQPISSSESGLHYYKSLFLIPQFFRVMKSLSRKTYFNDDNLRNANRSQRFARQSTQETPTVNAAGERDAPTTDTTVFDL